jgi:hypothetical protein
MCDSSHIIGKGMKICDACREQFKVQTVLEEQDCSVPVAARTNIAGPSRNNEAFVDLDVSLQYLNKSLVTLQESPVAKKRLQAPSYCDKKLRKIRCLKEKVLTTGSEDVYETIVKNDTDSEMLNQLKEKFKEENLSVSEKLQILTVLPKSWTCNNIQNEFAISNRMARKVKALVKINGIFATRNPKWKVVKQFCRRKGLYFLQ